MQERHIDRERYFHEQCLISKKVVLPYIATKFPVSSKTVIAEIGCGEAGNLFPFLEMGCKSIGIDCSTVRIERAKTYYSRYDLKGNLTLMVSDVFELDPKLTGKFDLIIIRDSLEHIPNQEKLFIHLKEFLTPQGFMYIAFPPWRMPFGGHQQMCENRLLSKVPYIHLLPKTVFAGLLKLFGEKKYRIDELLEMRSTRIGIQKFKKIIRVTNLKIEREDFFLISPAYEIKFKLRTRKLSRLMNIPFLRDFYTTACYYLLSYHPTTSENKE